MHHVPGIILFGLWRAPGVCVCVPCAPGESTLSEVNHNINCAFRQRITNTSESRALRICTVTFSPPITMPSRVIEERTLDFRPHGERRKDISNKNTRYVQTWHINCNINLTPFNIGDAVVSLFGA